MNIKKIKLIVNIIVFTLLAVIVVLALITFYMLGEGERVNLSKDKPEPKASPQ